MNDYQAKAAEFAVYETVDYPLLALGEEVGELQGKVAKYIRKSYCNAEEALIEANEADEGVALNLRQDLVSEAGDVLWNLSNLLKDLDITLDDVARMNIDKLLRSVRSE